jgi:hypothetical protein
VKRSLRRNLFWIAFVAGAACWVLACSLDGLSGGVRPDAGAVDGGGDEVATAVDGVAESGDPTPTCPSIACDVLVINEDHPTEMTLVGDRLFWIRESAAGDVVSADLMGGDRKVDPDHRITNAHDLSVVPRGDAYAISADGTFARYVDYSTCVAPSGMLRMTPIGNMNLLFVKTDGLYRGDCGGNNRVSNEAGGNAITAVDTDSTNAWYARKNGDIVRCDITANACETSRAVIATGQGAAITTIVHDDSRVYWIAGNEIRSLKKSVVVTGTPDVIASSSTPPKALSIASSVTLYFTDIEAGTIHAVDIATKTSSVIAGSLKRPWGITSNTTHVFVAESGNGRILRLRR